MRGFERIYAAGLGFITIVAACVGSEPPAASSSSGDNDGGASSSGASSGTTSSSGSASGGDAAACAAPKTQCGASCADLQTDKAHCGKCDHGCGGGDCTAGVCQPVTIAASIDEPVSVTVTANSVVWIRRGAVESCPLGACSSPKSITGEGNTFAGTITDEASGRRIVTTATDVFWIGDPVPDAVPEHVYKCALTGCAGGVVTEFYDSTSFRLGQLAVAGNNIYATSKGLDIARCDGTQATCTSPYLLNGTADDPAYSVAVDPDRVYWTAPKGPSVGNFGGAFTCSNNGCSGTSTMLADPAWSLAWHAGVLYINQYGKIGSCDATNGCSGSPKELASGQDQKTPIAADGNGVYWVQRGNEAADAGPPNGRVLMCRLPDCAGGAKVLATGQAAPRSIAVLDGFVYWANRGTGATKTGSIMRVRY